MKIYQIENLLKAELPNFNVDGLPKSLLEIHVELEEVVNVDEFIETCLQEAKTQKSSGRHRQLDWEEGWQGRGTLYEPTVDHQVPYYFYKNTHLRLGHKVFVDHSRWTEYFLLRLLQLRALNSIEEISKNGEELIVEFGCGTGHNLKFLQQHFPKCKLQGADWAQSAVDLLKKTGFQSKRVDFFDETSFWDIKEPYYAFTNASLEQTGSEFKKFIGFLIDDLNCKGAIHIEPVQELLGDTKLEVSSKQYSTQRQYLNGFLDFLKKDGRVEVKTHKNLIGSKYLYGYQIVTWSKSQ